MNRDNNSKFSSSINKILTKLKPRFSLHYVSYTALLFMVVFSTVHLVTATTPNPGHPWTEVGDGNITFTDPATAVVYTGPTVSATLLTTANLVTPAQGGTGIGTYAVGDLIYASGTTTLAKLADVATGSCLISGGVATAPLWGSCTSGGIAWSAITNPTTTQSLTFDDGELNAWTVSSDTETFHTISSSTLTSGTLMSLVTTGTGALTGQKGLNISLSGANGTGAQTTYGAYISNTKSGTSNNVGLYATATGGTNNYAAIFDAGNVGIGQTTPTSKLQINKDQNSVSQDDANGILLANATAATVGVQSISPGIVLQGNGWKTNATAGSQDVRFRQDVLPVQGAANPSATWQLASSINGGAYANRLTVASSGDVTIPGASNILQAPWIVAVSGFSTSVQYNVANSTSGAKLYRTTNGGSDVTPGFFGGSSGVVTAGTLGYATDVTNGFSFTAANGTRHIARAGLQITNLSNSAGSESGDLTFYTQAAGAAMAQRFNLTGSATTATATIGVAGSTLGGLNLTGNTSGTISILPQAAAGTYNFNLPTTAGNSGEILTSAGGAGSPMTWTAPGALAVRWNSIANPTGTQTLAFDDGELNAWTVSSDTETFHTITANSLTTGKVLSIASSSLTTGSLIDLAITGTAASVNQTGINISLSGANASAGVDTFGIKVSNTHTDGSSLAVNNGVYSSTTGQYGVSVTGTNSGGGIGVLGSITSSTNFGAAALSGSVAGDGYGAQVTSTRSASTTNFAATLESTTTGTFNTGGGVASSYAGYFSSTTTRSAGASALTNIGLYATASGAQNNYAAIFDSGNVGVGTTAPTARLHLGAGTTTAGTAPLKFTSGTSLTAAEAGAVEFTTDDLFFTITTGAARKRLLMADPSGGLTSTRVPFATTNGRLTDGAGFVFNGTSTLSLGAAGTGTGGLNLLGTTSGTVSILPQAAAGTYNFNLPIIAGTSGHLLTSGGGGGTAMTWTDPATFAPASGSANYIQNQIASAQSANAWLSGTLAVNTSLSAGGFATPGTFPLEAKGSVLFSDANTNGSVHTITTGPVTTTAARLAIVNVSSGGANVFLGGEQGGGGVATNPAIYLGDHSRAYAAIQGVLMGGGGTNQQYGDISFSTSPDISATALTERLRISSVGLVSIAGNESITSTNTTQATTSSALALNVNSLTTGTGFYAASSTLTTGKLVDLQVSGTAADASQTALNILTTGANGTAGVTTYGAQISNTHSTNTSTNVGLLVSATGGATANYALLTNGGNVGIGDTSPVGLFTVGASDAFQVNSSGAIAAAAGITSSGTITFSGLGGGGTKCLQTDNSGVITAAAAACGTGGAPAWNSITVPTGDLTLAMDSDVTTFNYDTLTTQNAFTLASTSLTTGKLLNLSHTTAVIANGGSLLNLSSTSVDTSTTTGVLANFSSTASTAGTQFLQTYSGLTTGIGQSIVANALTSGTALSLSSSAAANFTGSLASISLSDGTGASSNTGSLLTLLNAGTANANTSMIINHYATGTGNLAFRVNDVSGDTTPFVIDGTGNVGVGDSTPASLFTVGDTDLFQINSSGQIGSQQAPVSDYLFALNGNTTNDNSRIIDIVQANNANEDTSSIYITATPSLGSIGATTKNIRGSYLSLTPSATVNAAGFAEIFGEDTNISLSSVSLSTSASNGIVSNTKGNSINITGSPVVNDPSGANQSFLTVSGVDSTVAITPTFTNAADTIYTTYGGNFSNTSTGASFANLVSEAYGVKASTSGNLLTTGTTTHYGGHFASSGTADTNYGVYTTASGATTNMGGNFNASSAGTTNYGIYATASGATNNYAGIFTGGNVGIGITAPTSLLHVQQSADSAVTATPVGFDLNSAGATGELTASSGVQTFARIAPTLNQTSTAGYTALLVNATQTATGSGAKLLQDWQVGGVSMAKIDSTGALTVTSCTGCGGGGSTWNGITAPTGTQSLTFDDGELNAWTVSSDTETFHTISSSTLTSGTLMSLVTTGTGALTGQKGLNISLSGANGTGAQTTYGAYLSNTKTGTSNNVGLYATATGGTNNYAGIFEAGRVLIGTASDTTSIANLYMSRSLTNETGSTGLGVSGIHQDLTFASSSGTNTQVGNRLVVTNSGSVANTLVGQIVRMADNTTSLANTVRGIEVVATAGSTSSTTGTNTGIRATGGTFGVQGITTGLVGGTLAPAALYGEMQGTTQGDALRLYSTTITSSPQMAYFYHDTSTFTGNGITMDMATGSGAFTGNFLDFQNNNSQKLKVTSKGELSLLSTDADNATGFTINTEESTAGQVVFQIESDANSSADTNKFKIDASGATYTTFINTSTAAACHATNGTTTVADEIVDCAGSVNADFAELYPVEAGVEYGDIVAVGTEMVNTYDAPNGNIDWNKEKGKITKLVKSNKKYQSNTIGIVSNNYGDFTLAGHNIKDIDNPMPIALNGRVPVKIASGSDAISPGDYITTSEDQGKGEKATKGGFVIGKALEAWTPESGAATIMVYVEQGFYDGKGFSQFAGIDPVDSSFAKQVLKKFMNSSSSDTGSEMTLDRLLVGVEIVTPKLTADTIATNIISAGTGKDIGLILSPDGKLIIGGQTTTNADGTTAIDTSNPAITFDALGNATFSGKVTAKEIEVNSLAGIQDITNQINELSEGQAAFTLTAQVMNTLSSALTLAQADILKLQQDLGVAQQAIAGLTTSSTDLDGRLKLVEAFLARDESGAPTGIATIGLSVSGDGTFAGKTQFDGLSFFSNTTSFTGGVNFGGQAEFTLPPLYNKDSAGYALVKQGDRRAKILFETPYIATPVVNTSITFETGDNIDDAEASTLFGNDVRFIVTSKDQTGFTILLNKNAPRDIRFSWNALAVRDPSIFESVYEGLIIDPTPPADNPPADSGQGDSGNGGGDQTPPADENPPADGGQGDSGNGGDTTPPADENPPADGGQGDSGNTGDTTPPADDSIPA